MDRGALGIAINISGWRMALSDQTSVGEGEASRKMRNKTASKGQTFPLTSQSLGF